MDRDTNEMPLARRLGQIPQFARLGHRAGIDSPAAVAEVKDAVFLVHLVAPEPVGALVSVVVILKDGSHEILVEQRTPVPDDPQIQSDSRCTSRGKIGVVIDGNIG